MSNNLKEVLKEVGRWLVASVYSIILELITTGQFDLKDPKALLFLILFRLIDRLAYLWTNQTKVETVGRSLLLIK